MLMLTCVVVVLGTASQASASTRKNAAASVPERDSYRVGRLIVQRSANFGNDLFLNLSIDGRQVANIAWNYRYDAWISAGHHVVTVLAVPRSAFRRPSSRRITIIPGQTHIFTGVWESDRVVLRRAAGVGNW